MESRNKSPSIIVIPQNENDDGIDELIEEEIQVDYTSNCLVGIIIWRPLSLSELTSY